MSAPMPGAGAPERARNNLEELGMDAMASSAAEYAALVASGAKTFPQALMEMTDAQVAAVRARDLDRRVEKANFPYVKTLVLALLYKHPISPSHFSRFRQRNFPNHANAFSPFPPTPGLTLRPTSERCFREERPWRRRT